MLPPGVILDVPYEALVHGHEAWSWKIVEFVGLDWDERCLDFHRKERSVGMASYWQVRQKMFLNSVERWRSYEQFAGPLMGLRDLY